MPVCSHGPQWPRSDSRMSAADLSLSPGAHSGSPTAPRLSPCCVPNVGTASSWLCAPEKRCELPEPAEFAGFGTRLLRERVGAAGTASELLCAGGASMSCTVRTASLTRSTTVGARCDIHQSPAACDTARRAADSRYGNGMPLHVLRAMRSDNCNEMRSAPPCGRRPAAACAAQAGCATAAAARNGSADGRRWAQTWAWSGTAASLRRPRRREGFRQRLAAAAWRQEGRRTRSSTRARTRW